MPFDFLELSFLKSFDFSPLHRAVFSLSAFEVWPEIVVLVWWLAGAGNIPPTEGERKAAARASRGDSTAPGGGGRQLASRWLHSANPATAAACRQVHTEETYRTKLQIECKWKGELGATTEGQPFPPVSQKKKTPGTYS
eukprot:EG_transcript_35269